ncbi:transporter, major facilitator family protein [Lentilactobacillus kefiri DSM 20587 = JCM 5818]|uniref:Transporter, major facilitator family protein n=3 Tax=Lentilactobacillus kefiri TaxID=33962 RepID=A0A8E1RHZ7_LENKE|nr:transporter, major facilitator family protein [Lentilactobacillus parakefiri DSM 10551]KRM49805.1 transporter, major facilitator family protein [Lentilactobacillus kefiri DSM 20587 = JCM 5818]
MEMMLKKHFRFFDSFGTQGSTATADPDAISPETGKPWSKSYVWRFLIAFVIYGILNNAAFTLNGAVLLPQHIKDVGIVNPTAAYGIITSVTSLVSLFVGYIWGTLSDKTRSRFGKRTPWIFVGSFVAGIGLYSLGIFESTTSLTLAYIFNTLGQNAIQTPMYAFLADRAPKNVRGTLSAGFGATSIGAPVGQFISSYFLGQSFQNTGFIVGGVLIALSGLIVLLITPREKSSKDAVIPKEESVLGVFATLLPPKMHGAHDFYKACAGRFLVMTSYTMIFQYLLYILENHIGLSVLAAARAMNKLSIFTLVVSLLGLAFSGPISDRLKARKIPVAFGGMFMIFGTVSLLLFKSVNGVIGYVVLAGLGYGIYLAVDMALNIDVIPAEAKENKTTGKYVGFGNLTNTAGQMIAPAATSMIVTATGSYGLVFWGSIITTLVGTAFILWIKHVK